MRWEVDMAALAVLCGIGCAAVAAPAESASSYQVLYSFQGGSDGAIPWASLIDVGGTLYGTTYAGGGATECSYSASNGCGTVFAVDPRTGAESVVAAFTGGIGDATGPEGGLIDFGGALYGTSTSGGTCTSNNDGCGTIFGVSLRRNGSGYGVFYRFSNFPDSNPVGNLVRVGPDLYGTTFGTIYSFSPKGRALSTIYSFGQSSNDAWGASAGLIDVGGIFYGTTEYGGTYGYGTVYSFDLSTGVETVLYSFQGGSDGYHPMAGLIDVNGTLYGTTVEGGSGTCKDESPATCGTIFKFDLATGVETVVHSFQGFPNDGEVPSAGLLQVGGRLFGTTSRGGVNRSYGTLFSLNLTSGAVAILHSFGGSGDGAYPAANLIDIGGTLYGTTEEGGTSFDGTVFAFHP